MSGDLEDEYEDTCFVYDCPDSNPSLLKTDSIYDYYGIYDDIGKFNFFTFLFIWDETKIIRVNLRYYFVDLKLKELGKVSSPVPTINLR